MAPASPKGFSGRRPLTLMPMILHTYSQGSLNSARCLRKDCTVLTLPSLQHLNWYRVVDAHCFENLYQRCPVDQSVPQDLLDLGL